MEQLEFHDPSSRSSWQQCELGIHMMIVNEDAATGRRSLLQRYDPGAANATSIVPHPYIEEVYIIEGDLTDTTLGRTFTKGMYAYRKPGMKHGPYASQSGCLMFVTCVPPS